MAQGRFVSYLRVSTDRQGKSGLGLEAQRAAVENYLKGGKWKLINEFLEVESGRRSDRPKLAEALAMCRAHRAALVVAKVDRLAAKLPVADPGSWRRGTLLRSSPDRGAYGSLSSAEHDGGCRAGGGHDFRPYQGRVGSK
jgi:Resolvase, N terminal domain